MEASDCIESVAESAPSAEEFSRQRRRMTLPERLCFLLDTGPEMAAVWEEGEQRLDAMKMAIKLIIRRKVNLNPKHQYALATFDGNGSLNHVCEFTSSVSEIDTALERVKQSTSPESPVDLSHLVDSLQQKVFHSAAESAVENSLCRCVLVFGRSSTVMKRPKYEKYV